MRKTDTFFDKLFDPSGQSGRMDYLITFLVSQLLALILIGIYTTIVAHIRRWHDLGRSGWWTLLFLIPLVNFIVFLCLLFTPGVQQGSRVQQVGPDSG